MKRQFSDVVGGLAMIGVFGSLIQNAGGWINMQIELGLHPRPALVRINDWYARRD